MAHIVRLPRCAAACVFEHNPPFAENVACPIVFHEKKTRRFESLWHDRDDNNRSSTSGFHSLLNLASCFFFVIFRRELPCFVLPFPPIGGFFFISEWKKCTFLFFRERWIAHGSFGFKQSVLDGRDGQYLKYKYFKYFEHFVFNYISGMYLTIILKYRKVSISSTVVSKYRTGSSSRRESCGVTFSNSSTETKFERGVVSEAFCPSSDACILLLGRELGRELGRQLVWGFVLFPFLYGFYWGPPVLGISSAPEYPR